MSTTLTRIKQLRKQQGQSQAVLAQVLGVSRRSYNLYELGQREMSISQLQTLAEHFGVSPNWLLYGSDGSTAQPATVPESLRVLGMAECSLSDWYRNDDPLALSLPCPPDMDAATSFAVMARGTSLQPEGIRPGFLCLCSTAKAYQPGDIVFLEEHGGHISLKVLLAAKDMWLDLKGYLPPDETGTQKPYTDRRPRGNIKTIAPVVYIKRKL